MQFLNDYMSASERENAIFEAQMNRESIALDNKFNSLMQEHALRLSDIDLSVALERYSDDDTQALFEREMTIYMEGVKEWWAEFKKWFGGLIGKLCGKTPEVTNGLEAAKNADGKVTLPCDVDEVIKSGDSIFDKVKKFLSIRKDDGSLDAGKIAAEAGGSIAIAALLGVGGKKLSDAFKPKDYEKKDLPPLWERFVAFFNKSKQTVDDIKDDTPEGNSIKSIIMKVFNAIKDFFNKVKSAVVGLVKKDKPAIEGEDPKALPGGENTSTEGETETTSDDKPEGKDGSDINKAKKAAKARIIKLAQTWGFHDRSKGNKITVDEMAEYVTKIEEKAKKNKNEKILKEVEGFKEVIKDCKDAGIMEFAIDEILADSVPMFEASMTPIDDAIIERELMLMTESEEADVAELVDLVDSL